jgi:hypothetical protein
MCNQDIVYTLLISSLIVLMSGCVAHKIKTEAPMNKTVQAPPIAPKLSYLNLPISLKVKPLMDKINKELPTVLYEDNNVSDDNYAIKLSKNGDIKIFAADNYLYYSIPLKVYAKGDWKWQPTSLLPAIHKTADTDFDLVINCQTSVMILPNWKLKTKTDLEYKWGTKPKIDFGPISIPIAFILDPIISTQMGKITSMLDEEVSKRIDLPSIVKDAWINMQKPILVNKENATWLKIEPQEIRATPISFLNNEISLKVGIKSFISTQIGKEPIITKNSIHNSFSFSMTKSHL